MSGPIKRYENKKIVNHLASQYVIGHLSSQVKKRVDRLIKKNPHCMLSRAISHWEEKMFPLNSDTNEIPPKAATWKKIKKAINNEADTNSVIPDESRLIKKLFAVVHIQKQWQLTFVLCFLIFAASFWNSSTVQTVPLSYIAVLSSEQHPTLVATTYGSSRELALEILDLKPLALNQDYELWVVSKTDNIARSLGVVDMEKLTQKRELSEAEWRLIKDSDSLLLTVEEQGGSPFGEPSNTVISKGLCIRLPSGNENV